MMFLIYVVHKDSSKNFHLLLPHTQPTMQFYQVINKDKRYKSTLQNVNMRQSYTKKSVMFPDNHIRNKV